MNSEQDLQIERAKELLGAATTASLATVSPDGLPQNCTIFVTLLGSTTLVFKSRRASAHMQALGSAPSAHLSCYDPAGNYDSKHGLQLKGHVRAITDPAEMTRTVEAYERAFTGSSRKLPPVAELCQPDCPSTFFAFVISDFRVTVEEPGRNLTMSAFADAQQLSFE